ncbi:MAG: WD40 repeat domain-containing protein [Pirellulaceae bacterium]
MVKHLIAVCCVLVCCTDTLFAERLPREYEATNLGYAWRHDAPIIRIAKSLDGKRIATLSFDASVVVWRFDGLKAIAKLDVQTEEHLCLALSADGSKVALLHDQAVEVWDVNVNKRLFRLEFSADAYTQVAFADGVLATSQREGTVCLWDESTGKRLRRFDPDQESPVTGLRVSHDGKAVEFKVTGETTLKRWIVTEDQPTDVMWLANVGVGVRQLDYHPPTGVGSFNEGKRIYFVNRKQYHGRPPISMYEQPKFHVIRAHALSGDGLFAVSYAGEGVYQVSEPGRPALHVDAGATYDSEVCDGLVWPIGDAHEGWYAVSGYPDGRISAWKLPGPQTSPVKYDWWPATLEAIAEEDFQKLEQLYHQCREIKSLNYRGDHHLHEWVQWVATRIGETPSLDDRFLCVDRWRKAQPESIARRTVELFLWYEALAEARGSGYASSLSAEKVRLLEDLIPHARRALDEAKESGPLDLICLTLAINIEKLDPTDPNAVMRYVADSLKISPMPVPVLTTAVEYFLPRWHGAPGELEAFIATTTSTIGGDDGEDMFVRMVDRWKRYDYKAVFDHRYFDFAISERRENRAGTLSINDEMALASSGNGFVVREQWQNISCGIDDDQIARYTNRSRTTGGKLTVLGEYWPVLLRSV